MPIEASLPEPKLGRVLIIAGSDSGGGAGIQADLKTVTCLGGYAATAITALTAQNTLGVFAIHPVPPDFLRQQIELVLEDIGADCVKIGMLATAEIIEAVADSLEATGGDIPLVLDPVMTAKGGAALLAETAMEALKRRLIPRAALLTPNLPEAEALTGLTIQSAADGEEAARRLLALGAQAVLLKGGHASGDVVSDLLVWQGGGGRDGLGWQGFSSPRLQSNSTHGTGCTLASAVACGLAQGLPLVSAVARARAYVIRAIETAPGLGRGHGPLNHGHTVGDFRL